MQLRGTAVLSNIVVDDEQVVLSVIQKIQTEFSFEYDYKLNDGKIVVYDNDETTGSIVEIVVNASPTEDQLQAMKTIEFLGKYVITGA